MKRKYIILGMLLILIPLIAMGAYFGQKLGPNDSPRFIGLTIGDNTDGDKTITFDEDTADGTLSWTGSLFNFSAQLTENGNAVPNSTDNLSFFASTTSGQLAGVLSNETGSDAAVFGTGPTLSSPVIQDIAPGGDFTLSQNSVDPFTSVESGAVSDTLVLKAGNVGIGTTAPDAALEVNHATGDNLRLTYNDSDGSAANYCDFEVDSSGNLTITPSGGNVTIAGALLQAYGVTWDESGDSYTRTGALAGYANGSSPGDAVLPIQSAMRRCVMSDSGEVLYYLCATDSTKKENCTDASDIDDGGDGQVMVQIPAFYYKYSYSGTTHSWSISLAPLDGYSLHPAFIKNGVAVAYRYIGAYEGSLYDDTASAMVGDADIETDMYAAGDILCSISGEYPKTNETRAEFRAAAAERGTGWRQMDFYLTSAVQLLYSIEYADFDSQSMIGNGRTTLGGGAWEAGSYIGIAGLSNSDGNATNAVQGGSLGDTDYMTYRGIENFFGNVWKWVDGININDHVPYFCNDDTDFADDTATNYYDPGITLPASNDYPTTLEQVPDGFLAAAGGGSSSTYICDYYYQNSGWRVARLGGSADDGANAGVFYWSLINASSDDNVSIGSRLCF